MWTCFLAGTALNSLRLSIDKIVQRGTTLIELLVVVTVMGILLALAVPSYSSYMLRVNRTEAIRQLLQAAMCQERIRASRGSYDTGQCDTNSAQQHYRISYQSPNSKGLTYIAMATPTGGQLEEPCGSLLLNQNGVRSISAADISATKCWNGR